MAAADAIIARDGPVAVPLEYEVPASAAIVPVSVSATVDGASAAGSFVPALVILTPSGQQLGPYPLDATLAAGVSARVSWFPGVPVAASGGSTMQTFIGATLRGGTLLVPNDTQTDLTYSAVEVDTDGMANLAADNRKLTVNTAGYYLVMVSTVWAYNNSGRRINAILRNDVWSNPLSVSQAADARMQPWDPFPGDGIGGNSDNLSWRIYHAAAGDFFATGVYQNSGSAINCNSGGPASSFFSAALIGV